MHNLIPVPSQFEPREGLFKLTAGSKIICCTAPAKQPCELLAEYLRPATGFKLPVTCGVTAEPGDIVLSERGDNTPDDHGFLNEKYTLDATAELLKLSAEGVAGLHRGIQTIRQLLPAQIYGQDVAAVDWTIQGCHIEDFPRFRWRGLHFDVSRHFFTEDQVCRFIELAAQHKFNTFHWHLTDDQGWRIEIKKYPRLTEVGAWRDETLIEKHEVCYPHRFDGKRYGGFYTQDGIRNVVAFAAQRGINIVPEIDMPGHMQAAVAAYPELGNNPDAKLKVRTHWGISQNILNPEESTIGFCKDVLAEVMTLFPSKIIHIGGDEAEKYEWDDSARANQRMIETNSANSTELQNYFMRQISAFLEKNGRHAIGWEEIAHGGGLPENAIAMSWLSEDSARDAIKQKAYMVSANIQYTYFDFYQADPKHESLCIGGDTPCEKVYRFDPIPKDTPAEDVKYVLGAQAQHWTEYMDSFARVEYQSYPRACALSEKLWSPAENCCFLDFAKRLKNHRERLAQQNVNAHPLP